MYELTQKEHDAVLSLNAEYRQAHFLQKVKEEQGLYILLQDDGPYLLEDTEEDDDNKKSYILPVWCHEQYATEYAKAEKLDGLKPQFVTLKAWNENWVKMLQDQSLLLGFMLVSDGDFTVEDPIAF